MNDLSTLQEHWQAAWPDALRAWSKFTRLRPPTLCLTKHAADREGLSGSFAMIRLVDQAVVVSLPEVARAGIGELAVEVLAHEIGHHVLAPATLSDHACTIARMRAALPTLERHAPMVANLYTDLLINDRLQRSAGLRMGSVYRALSRDGAAGGRGAVWSVYLRIYEVLWSLPRGSLGGGPTADRQEGDAWLGARLLRSYARDWLDGSGRFASLLLPYLVDDEAALLRLQKLFDTRDACQGGEPAGLSEVDDAERTGAIHPATDPELDDDAGPPSEPSDATDPSGRGAGQRREPFEYGEILRAAGLALDDHEAAVRYYRERAMPQLVRFPRRRLPQTEEPLPEGLEPWDAGHSLDAVDWLQSVLQSPRVVPGMTTVQRVWGTSDGQQPRYAPVDLDLYVDSSGSMVNPQRQLSFPALAGAIIALSALRAGARVQATLWSGARQFIKTDGFVLDQTAILRVLTGYLGGGTAFPIHVLRDTFARRARTARAVHVLVVSDDGVSTMFDEDERGNNGWETARVALQTARGGATFVLNLPQQWEDMIGTYVPRGPYGAIARARDELGIAVHAVSSWEDLLDFARAFSRHHYTQPVESSP